MDTTREQQTPLHQQLAEFEKDNPQIVEAMRLFDMTMTEYQGALHALHDPHIYLSSSTTPTNAAPQHRPRHG